MFKKERRVAAAGRTRYERSRKPQRMKPATFTHAAPSARPGKLDEFTQSERGHGTQHFDPWPVVSKGFFAQLRPPRSGFSCQFLLVHDERIEMKLTAFGIWVQTLADEGVRASTSIERDVSKQCKQISRHCLLVSDFRSPNLSSIGKY